MSTARFVIIAKAYDRKGRLLSIGHNQYMKSHPLQKAYAIRAGLPVKDKLHAEIQCLVRSGDKPVHRLAVERYLKDSSMALAKPCPVCQEAIKDFGVKFVEYTTPNGWVKEKICLDF